MRGKFFCLFGQWLSRIELSGKTKLNAGRKKAESVRSHVAARGERHKLPAIILKVAHKSHGKI